MLQTVTERAGLVKALAGVALAGRRKVARRFLDGLSTEELRYIAGYLGACLLESALVSRPASREEIAGEIIHYECSCRNDDVCGPTSWNSGDVEHKMILLLEYLSCCQCSSAVKVPAGSA